MSYIQSQTFLPSGGGFSFKYTFSDSTSSGPSAGQVRLNNAASASATQIFISETDRNSKNMAALLDLVAANTGLLLTSEADPSRYAYYVVTGSTDNSSDRTLAVTHVASSSTLTGNVTISVAGGGGGSGGASLTLTEQAQIPSTSGDEIKLANVSNNFQWRLESNGLTYTAAATNRSQSYTGAQTVSSISLIDTFTISTNASQGNVFTVTLFGNRTLGAPTNLQAGGTYLWIITQGSSSRTLQYNSIFKFPNGLVPELSTAANAIDVLTCVYNGTALLCNLVKDFR